MGLLDTGKMFGTQHKLPAKRVQTRVKARQEWRSARIHAREKGRTAIKGIFSTLQIANVYAGFSVLVTLAIIGTVFCNRNLSQTPRKLL